MDFSFSRVLFFLDPSCPSRRQSSTIHPHLILGNPAGAIRLVTQPAASASSE
jgi:hypothetical protein